MRWIVLMLLCAGCATKARVPSAIMPPKVKIPKSAHVPVQRTTFTLKWEDCSPQPSNCWYQVFERQQLSDAPTLYAELTNAYSLMIPVVHTAAFYTVEITNGKESRQAGRECK